MSLKVTGFDELQKKLKKMADGAKELEGEHQVAMPDLLTESFVSSHTPFKDAQELFDNSGFKIESQEDFQAIPDAEWDIYISSVSDFENWEQMLQSATAEYAQRKMGL
jgi:hypothetical protein